jgi:hypothetical protein
LNYVIKKRLLVYTRTALLASALIYINCSFSEKNQLETMALHVGANNDKYLKRTKNSGPVGANNDKYLFFFKKEPKTVALRGQIMDKSCSF